MAEEIVDGEAAPKRKLPIKLILAVLGLILLIVLTIVGTLAVTGFFSKPDAESIEELLKKAEAEKANKEGADGPADEHGAEKKGEEHAKEGKEGDHAKDEKGAEGEGKGDKPTPEPNKFESKYKELSRPLVANIQGSRKVMQVTLAVMTHYDEKVIKNMEKHELALRSAALDILRQTTESEIEKPTFRADLAEKIRVSMNAVLEKYENFGGLEQVLFTEFVVQ